MNPTAATLTAAKARIPPVAFSASVPMLQVSASLRPSNAGCGARAAYHCPSSHVRVQPEWWRSSDPRGRTRTSAPLSPRILRRWREWDNCSRPQPLRPRVREDAIALARNGAAPRRPRRWCSFTLRPWRCGGLGRLAVLLSEALYGRQRRARRLDPASRSFPRHRSSSGSLGPRVVLSRPFHRQRYGHQVWLDARRLPPFMSAFPQSPGSAVKLD